jgi:hypothetical protein
MDKLVRYQGQKPPFGYRPTTPFIKRLFLTIRFFQTRSKGQRFNGLEPILVIDAMGYKHMLKTRKALWNVAWKSYREDWS